MPNSGDIVKSQEKQVDLLFTELSLPKQLIKERAHLLDLLRELISNAGAKEVGATEETS